MTRDHDAPAPAEPWSETARLYLLWVRLVIPVLASVATVVLWMFVDTPELLAIAAVMSVSGVLVGPLLLLSERSIGAARALRISAYIDLALVMVIVALLDREGLPVLYLWPIVVAAMLCTTWDTIAITVVATVASTVVPLLTGTDDPTRVAFEGIVLMSVGAMITMLRVEEHRAERRRRRLERLLEEAQRLAHLGSYEYDPATGVARWSPELYRIFQVPRGGVPLGQEDFLRTIVPEDRPRVREAFAARADGEQVEFETRIRRPDGEVRTIHVNGASRVESSGTRVVGTVQDVTELRRLDSMRDEFVAAASHELRTPTSIVLGFASTLAHEWDPLPEVDRRRFVHEIDDAAQRLALLVEDVLQVTQIESGQVRCEHEPFDLGAEVADVVRSWPDDTPIELVHGDEPGAASEPAIGDALRARQVLTNLIDNATRHAPTGTRVLVDVHSEGDVVVARVQDDGPGVPPDERARIFERFVRLRTDSSGTGLGLYISRRLAEAQDGSLEVESEPGHGSTFTFSLPADRGRVDA